MVRTVDHESRRRAVLDKAIKRYVNNALPVASEDLVRDFDLSSATIRNIFAELEEDGYLMHPHTSGGRVPTNKGYRYYVDFLLSQIELLDDEKQSIINEYEARISRFEDALEKTSEVISKITHYTGLVSFLEWQDKIFYRGMGLIMEQPEFRDIQKIRLILQMIEDKQYLLSIINRDFTEKVKVYIGEELGCPEINGCSLVVSNYRTKGKLLGRIAVLGPTRMAYENIIPKIEYISEVLDHILSDRF